MLVVHLKNKIPMLIREATAHDLDVLAMLVSTSNSDVALEFNLNSQNSPKHPSFCTPAWIEQDLARDERYFILEQEGQARACVAYERPQDALAYLNRLSVLPAYRNQGLGARLVRFIVKLASSDAVNVISIGVIGEHLRLQRWYGQLGFTSGARKQFAHLPFAVQYMSYAVKADESETSGNTATAAG